MMRLDQALVTRHLARSRSEARELLDSGQVMVDGKSAEKASAVVANQTCIDVIGQRMPYVSRGGLKLAAALDCFGMDVVGRTALDIGASTGGFTDCLLQRGVLHVTAVDVGTGQMAPKIAEDPRVLRMDQTNARDLTVATFGQQFELIVADVSFISLTLLIPSLVALMGTIADMVVLVKPQFEVGRENLGKGGIVRLPEQREAAVQRVLQSAAASGLKANGQMTSPILGAHGNEEYLLWLKAV